MSEADGHGRPRGLFIATVGGWGVSGGHWVGVNGGGHWVEGRRRRRKGV